MLKKNQRFLKSHKIKDFPKRSVVLSLPKAKIMKNRRARFSIRLDRRRARSDTRGTKQARNFSNDLASLGSNVCESLRSGLRCSVSVPGRRRNTYSPFDSRYTGRKYLRRRAIDARPSLERRKDESRRRRPGNLSSGLSRPRSISFLLLPPYPLFLTCLTRDTDGYSILDMFPGGRSLVTATLLRVAVNQFAWRVLSCGSR